MDSVKEWAIGEFNRLASGGIFEQAELQSLFDNLCEEDANKISQELSNLLDFSVKENKAFIKDFAERVAQAKAYQEKARKVASSTNYKNKEMGGGTKS